MCSKATPTSREEASFEGPEVTGQGAPLITSRHAVPGGGGSADGFVRPAAPDNQDFGESRFCPSAQTILDLPEAKRWDLQGPHQHPKNSHLGPNEVPPLLVHPANRRLNGLFSI